MTDELNQVQDMTTDNANESVVEEDDLFADYDPSLNEDIPTEVEDEDNQTSNEVVKEEKVEEQPDSQVAMSQNQTPFLEIKYNKEAKNLTKDEAIEYAQKGMNYDNILNKYNALKGRENFLNRLGTIAQKANLSEEQLADYLENQWNEHELEEETNAIKQMYPNSDDKLIEELAKQHIADRSNMVSKQKEQKEEARKQEISRQMDVFAKRYPDVDMQHLDQQVYRLMSQNYTLLEAYESVQADKRAAEAKEKESLEKQNLQNEENKKRSLGNTSNKGYADDDSDIFIKTLFSD